MLAASQSSLSVAIKVDQNGGLGHIYQKSIYICEWGKQFSEHQPEAPKMSLNVRYFSRHDNTRRCVI